ncbi:MAG TPA: NUDIX domain-containing protein [archaeon]|nr:NUDIX domain-containing protein [archaeon]
MTDLPLAVAIAAVVRDGKILLIKRTKGDYIGLWGLPGGKIEKNEHLTDAATREILEETGIQTSFQQHLGVVSEHLVENNQVMQHFLLHVCELYPQTMEINPEDVDRVRWFDLEKLEEFKKQIIPSDIPMIERLVKSVDKTHFNCIIEKVGNIHVLRKFE